MMLLAGIGSPQDAAEAVVRDYIARGHRTEARADSAAHSPHAADAPPPEPQG
ncbi:DUF2191 domain-containing protein [Streptomyces sp. NPDC099050]|uniref:DUF2191 domain-containing protein n=1 Tax=Streptomyces sp. NPDC099050 TaxID=3366100 RepID=UPI0037FA5E0B